MSAKDVKDKNNSREKLPWREFWKALPMGSSQSDVEGSFNRRRAPIPPSSKKQYRLKREKIKTGNISFESTTTNRLESDKIAKSTVTNEKRHTPRPLANNKNKSGVTGQAFQVDPQVTRIRPWSTRARAPPPEVTDPQRPATSGQSSYPSESARKPQGNPGIVLEDSDEEGELLVNEWSLTQIDDLIEQHPPQRLVTSEDEDDGDEDKLSEAAPPQDDADADADAAPRDGGQTLQDWLQGSGDNSDDYDTDLEQDFPPGYGEDEPEPPVDPTGAYHYEEMCKKQGIVPVSFLVRNMGTGNLRMRHHYLGGVGTRPLARALKVNTVCEEIDLSDNYMEGEGAAALAAMLKDNMFVVNLNISHNFIKSIGAAAFAEMLETNTTLKTLSLKGNQMSDWDAQKMSDAMKNNASLVCLDLSNNCFGEKAGTHLAVGIAANIGLNDLDLSWNGIREKGAVAVAKALAKNTVLEIFDISWNGFAHNGTVALAQSIRTNKALKVLDLSNNRIDTEAAKKLGQGLARNKALETILLGMNPIGEEGVEALLKGVEANKSLKLVGLEDISISPRLQQRIKDITSQRDIMIMYSSGSPQQSKINQTILAVFDRFISENADRMEDLFNQMDKDKTGMITLEGFKYGLKDFGLRLTSRQVDMLLDELDADRSGTIELDELMAGSNMVEQEKQKQARHEKEAQMMAEGMVIKVATDDEGSSDDDDS